MTTEAEAVADLVRTNNRPHIHQVTSGLVGIRTNHDESGTLFQDEALGAGPARPKGVVLVNDADSFARAVTQRTLSDVTPVLYADESTMDLVAVLNDDHGDEPGWRDYRVVLKLRPTPEWERWTSREGLHSQQTFAEHVEDSVDDFQDPSQADMLSLAQTFTASTTGRFKAGSNLSNGARQLTFEEEVQAEGGTDGTVTIPRSMRLGLRPFYGAVARDENGEWRQTRFAVEALFKFTIREGTLKIGYKLVQPDEIRRAAYKNLVEQVSEQLALSALSAPAPDVRHAPPLTIGT